MDLEKAIMAKAGVNDGDLWKELKECREEINALAQEKLLLVAKLYNLSQIFVQELDVAAEEVEKQLKQYGQSGRTKGASLEDLKVMNNMRSGSSQANAGKSFDETMIEPAGGDYSGKGMMDMAGKRHHKQRGQQRASDGKFESGFGGAGGGGGRKSSSMYGGGFGEGAAMNKFETQGNRKAGGRKRGGGGTVGSAFYDGALTASQPEPVLESSISGKLGDLMSGVTRVQSDEENKAMFESKDGLLGSIGLADNTIANEEGICSKC